jgi:hypothetical protein
VSIIPHPTLPAELLGMPCPTWCASDHAPQVDDLDGSALVVHTSTVLADAGGHRIDLVQTVDISADGTVTAGAPVVVVDEQLDDARTVEQTRAFLAGLALAAALADGATR